MYVATSVVAYLIPTCVQRDNLRPDSLVQIATSDRKFGMGSNWLSIVGKDNAFINVTYQKTYA